MNRTIYALLVGIDRYPDPRHRLYGCVNDVRAIETYLRERVAQQQGFQLKLETLLDDQSTRKDVIGGFRSHLAQAGKDDIVFFYFSGHGSQEQAPPQFWHLEPDRLDETLVCWDSRTEGGWDLADKELSKLISEIAQRGPHLAVVLDCCHSGSGTRAPLQETAVRRIPMDKRERPLDSFLFSAVEIERLEASRDISDSPTGWTLAGRHILLAACRDHQEAREYHGGGQPRGAFSYFLLDTLQKSGGPITYRDLFSRTNALVRGKIQDQSPQLEAIGQADLDSVFLDGAIRAATPSFTVSHDPMHGWMIDAGSAYGIPEPSAGETTILSLFPFDSTADRLVAESNAIGRATVEDVMAVRSKVRLQGINAPSPEQTFKAIISSLPLPRFGVQMEGDQQGLGLVREAIATAHNGSAPSIYVCESTRDVPARFRLLALDGCYWITRPESDRAIVQEIDGYNAASAQLAVARLEHIARWTITSELGNPASGISKSDVRISVKQGGQELTAEEIRLEYTYDADAKKWVQPSFSVTLANAGQRTVYCALLALSESFAISAALLDERCARLEPGNEVHALGGKPVWAAVPKILWENNVTEYRDTLKVIASTDDFDPQSLEQSALPPGRELPLRGPKKTTRSIGLKSSLGRMLERVQTRSLSAEAEEDEVNSDWLTSEVTITTIRPLESTPVSARDSAAVGAGVRLSPHATLKARVRLTTAPQAARDLGNLTVPPILRDDPAVTPPFQFTVSRGGDPGLSVLGLSDVENHTTVTPDNPLKLTVPQTLAENEHVLPVAFDGEFFLPLGKAIRRDGETDIVLERLPEPTSHGRKSLFGSIRIFFQKVVGAKLGVAYDYPHLAVADVDEQANVTYEHNEAKIRDRIGRAQRILLFIHGIIGDTKGMATSAQLAKVQRNGREEPLASLYDVILTFDYENIHTSIEDTARGLKQRLAAIGLGPDHGKTLHIAAHSMGGLVSRWFIEREGGNRVAQHLVMLGTPNGGSPWPTVQAWATTALAIGLNSMSTVAWPVKLLGDLMAAVETIDVTLDQMQGGSEFLKSLASSPDPSIAYSLLAGNTSIISAAVQPQPGDDRSLIRRLLGKIMSLNLLHVLTSPAFLGAPNDIAVALSSMKQVSGERSPNVQVHEVACDHLTYFSDANGLRAFGSLLQNL